MTDKDKITETAKDLGEKAKVKAKVQAEKAKELGEKAKVQAKEFGEKAKVQAGKAKVKAKSAASDASEAVRGAVKNEKGEWSTGAKVGAAVGSAAVAAAMLYAGRHKMKKLDDFEPTKPKADVKYENEPILDDEDDDLTSDYDGDYDGDHDDDGYPDDEEEE